MCEFPQKSYDCDELVELLTGDDGFGFKKYIQATGVG